MAEARIDVQVEHKHAPPPTEKKHPNTCPKCDSHYRDDELEAGLFVCAHCNHHFPVPARKRVDQLADAGTFVEVAADLRSEDPLGKRGFGRPKKVGRVRRRRAGDRGSLLVAYRR